MQHAIPKKKKWLLGNQLPLSPLHYLFFSRHGNSTIEVLRSPHIAPSLPAMAWLEASQACRHSLEHVCAHCLKGDAWNMGKPPGQSSVEHGDSARGQLWVWFVHIIMCWKPALQCDQGEVVRPVRTRSS